MTKEPWPPAKRFSGGMSPEKRRETMRAMYERTIAELRRRGNKLVPPERP